MAETIEELLNQLRANPHNPRLQDQVIALGDEGVPALLAVMEETSEQNSLASEVPQLLGRVERSTAAEALVGLLKHADKHVAAGAAISLGHRDDVAAAEGLIGALAHPEQDVRKYAACALGRIRSPDAVEPLIRLLQRDDWYVKIDAAGALGAIGDVRAVPSLLEALGDASEGSEFVIGYAAEALTTLDAHEAITPLIKHLGSENLRISEPVQESLAVLARGHQERLFEPARDPRAIIRARAVTILGKIGDQAAATVLETAAADEDKLVRDAARTAIRALRQEGVQVSVPARSSGDRMVDARRLLSTYFVVPSSQGFSPYRTGAGGHLFFSVSLGCGLGVLSQVWLGLDVGLLLGVVAAAVILLWGVGWMIGVQSHYNPLITLLFLAAPVVFVMVFGNGILLPAVAAVITHGLLAMVLSLRDA